MAYVTGFFLVFAGMLIGYFLWYRDRSEDEQNRIAMERETEELRAALKMAQNAHAILDERFVRQKGQLNVLQQLCDDWSSSREQTERDRAHLEVEVEDKQRKLENYSTELQKEKQIRVELEDQIHHLNQQNIEILNQVEQDWRERHSEIESKLEQRQLELNSAVGENERLISSLHRSEASLAESKSEIEANQLLLETATKNASGLEQEYVSLESSLKESSDLLKKSRSECAIVASEKKVAEETLHALQQDHHALQQECERLRGEVASMESLQNQVSALSQSLENQQEQLAKVTQQRDQAMKAEETSVAISTGLQHRIDNQESTIHSLREKHKDTMQDLQQELQARADLEVHLEKQKLDLEARIGEQEKQLELHSSELQNRYGKLKSDLESKIHDKSTQIEVLSQETKVLRDHLENSKQSLAAAEERIESLTTESACLNQEKKVLGHKVARLLELESHLQEREAIIQNQSDQISDLCTKLKDQKGLNLQKADRLAELEKTLANVRIEYAATGQKVFELEAKNAQNDAVVQKLKTECTTAEKEMDSIRMKLRAGEETIRSLRKERAGVLARLANYRTVAEPDATVISFTQAMEQKKRGRYDDEYGGHYQLDEKRGKIYTSVPESRDDLKMISGIAEVLEARLNDFGIYTFKQIMEWGAESVEEFSRLLAFRDRIQRDEWQEQASTLYKKKNLKSAA